MFAVAKFDSNNDTDAVCKELFVNKPFILKKKEKVKNGKVSKKKKKVLKNEKKIKEIKNIVSSNFTPNGVQKIKANKRKSNQNEQGHGGSNQAFDSGKKQQEDYNGILENKKKRKKKNKQGAEIAAKVAKTSSEQKTQFRENNETFGERPKKRKKKKKLDRSETQAESQAPANTFERKKKNFRSQFQQSPPLVKTKSKNLSLRERMMARLQAARFRYLNEQIYSTDSKEAQKIFKEDPEAFTAYHDGYRQQVGKWPLNPVDVIIKSIQQLPKSHIIADFGCGDAKIAHTVPQKVHSFDLVAINDVVTPCDMAHVPLENLSVDVVVFCLSLMGTNLHDYLLEANRVLKLGGTLKIAEVESRFDDVDQFIEALKRFNFKNTWKDLSHNLFYFLDFKKEANIKNRKKLPTVSLHPCLYKKR